MSDARVALVTGANKGIGLQIANGLAAHGLTVLVGSRNLDAGKAAAEGIDGQVQAIQLDVTDQRSIDSAADHISNETGHLDVLINNAGITNAGKPGRPMQEIAGSGLMSVVSLEEVRAVWETNVFGVIAVTHAMLPLLRQSAAPRIVNISSGGGSLTLNANPDNPHRRMFGNYPASKTALNAITLAFAVNLESDGFKVNAADPGFTRTDLNNNQGTGTVEDAAREPIRLALLDDDGPTGTFSNNNGQVPW